MTISVLTFKFTEDRLLTKEKEREKISTEEYRDLSLSKVKGRDTRRRVKKQDMLSPALANKKLDLQSSYYLSLSQVG